MTIPAPIRPPSQPDRDGAGVTIWLETQVKYYKDLAEHKRQEQAETDATPGVKEYQFYLVIAFVIAVLIGMVISIKLFIPPVMHIGPLPLNPQWILFLPLGAYILASFTKIDTDEVAGADLFGTPVKQFERGLKWIPWGILKLQREPRTFVQAEFPADIDSIQWDDEKEDLLTGKVRPIYVLFAENRNGTLPTEKQMNVGVSFLVQIQLIESRFFDLVRNISPIDKAKMALFNAVITGGNVSPRMLEVLRQLRDTGAKFALEIGGQISFNETTTNLLLVNELFKLRLEDKVAPWGVKVLDTSFTKINAGHPFNKEIQQRGVALAQKDATVTTAEGEKTKRTLEGEGAAAAKLADLTAQADGLARIAKVVSTQRGRTAQAGEVAKALGQSGNVTIVGADGLTDLFGIANVIKKKQEKP